MLVKMYGSFFLMELRLDIEIEWNLFLLIRCGIIITICIKLYQNSYTYLFSMIYWVY